MVLTVALVHPPHASCDQISGASYICSIDSRGWVANLHQGVLDQSWSFRSRSSLPSRSLLLAVGSALIQGSCRQLSPSGFCKVGVDTGIVHMSFGSWIPHSCSAYAEPPPALQCLPVAAISGSECAYCSCGLAAPLWTPPGYTGSSKTPLQIGQVRFSSTPLVNRLHHTSCVISETQVLLSGGGTFPFTELPPLDTSAQCHSGVAPSIPFC